MSEGVDRRGFLKALAALAGVGAATAALPSAAAAVLASNNGGKVRGGRINLGSGGSIDGCDIEDAVLVVQHGASGVMITNNYIHTNPAGAGMRVNSV